MGWKSMGKNLLKEENVKKKIEKKIKEMEEHLQKNLEIERQLEQNLNYIKNINFKTKVSIETLMELLEHKDEKSSEAKK